MLGLLRLWVLWRIARVIIPLLLAFVLLAALTTSTHHATLITVPHQLSGIVHTLHHDASGLIARSRDAVTNALLGKNR
jgi:hypothetical protein